MMFEYQRCPFEKGRRTYKFDHEPIGDATWRRLNQNTRAVYRVSGGYFQFVNPSEECGDRELAMILGHLDRCGPLQTDDELEILIRRKGAGWEMTSHWLFLGPGAEFVGFTRDDWNAAYERLRELEARAD